MSCLCLVFCKDREGVHNPYLLLQSANGESDTLGFFLLAPTIFCLFFLVTNWPVYKILLAGQRETSWASCAGWLDPGPGDG